MTRGLARPVLIAGPTASGKSALALAVAERDDGVVVNADALQVYEGWRVLTARPDDAACARAPHLLYGHVPMRARHSVGDWLREVAGVLEDAARARRRVVVVGGTGLYLTALTEGLAAIPAIDPAVRRRAEALERRGGVAALVDDLAGHDAETHAAIDLRNPARVRRAWEVVEATGRGLAAWHRVPSPPLVAPAGAVRILISPDVSLLNNNIMRRFHAMVEQGALAECRAALAAGWDARLPASRALGARELVGYLEGETGLDAAIAAAVAATRRYGKRQRTWFRSRMGDWQRVDPGAGAAADLLDRVPET